MASQILEDETWQTALNFFYARVDAAMICGAEYLDDRNVAKSGKMDDSDFFPSLKSRLLVYGNIGDQFENSSIGCCAEVNAANPIYHRNSLIDLNEIDLSKALRPKTMQERAKCRICTEIFLDDAL